MGATRVIAIAIVLAGSLSVAAADSTATATESTTEQGFKLDEYSALVSGASGAWQVGAGLTIGNSIGGGYHLFGGGRISWVQAEHSGETSNGWALGGIGGIGYLPAEKWSPVGTLALDKLFGMGGAYDWRLTASTGIRVRTSARIDQQQAISILFFGSTLYGSGATRNRGDYGLAIVYSMGFYEPD